MEERVFRNQETRSVAWIFAVGYVLIGASVLLAPGPVQAADLLFLAVGSSVGVAIAARWTRQGIYVDEEGVTVKGAFTTRHLSWEEISGFELRRETLIWQNVVAHVDLYDGSSVPARALNAGSGIIGAMRKRAEAQVLALNELLRARRGMSPY